MKRITLILLSSLFNVMIFGQVNTFKLIGGYYSINNKFERWSNIFIQENNRFKYEYGLGGCQGIITGSWLLIEGELLLANDKEFISNSSDENYLRSQDSTYLFNLRPIYPDLSQMKWRITKNWIKPINSIETGCFCENGKHKKK